MIELHLVGSAYSRGLQQAAAAPQLASEVRARIEVTQARAAAAMRGAEAAALAADLWDHVSAARPEAIAELRGIADGFGMPAFQLFCAWHVAVLEPLPAPPGEGCTAIALGQDRRALLAKNRDVPAGGERLQAVFRQHDPSWPCGPILSVSSLGSSAAASSGINAAGLCVADTHVATRDRGVGLLRYVLMQLLLEQCGSVAEAIALIRVTRHAGGGTLVLADADGSCAAVDLGHRHVAAEIARGGRVARTNHHVSAELRPLAAEPPHSAPGADSRARLDLVACFLDDMDAPDASSLARLLSGHGDVPLCRHHSESAATISCAIYDPRARSLAITDGPPCASPRLEFTL